MEPHLSTTPFGRRTLSLAHVAAQTTSKARPPEKAAHKWKVYQAICAGKDRLGVTERALAVLNALLTFHPETVLTGDNLVVFPSNEQLAKRANGMAPSTLRRHLGVLVDAGVIIRRDSPNGKRYARKDRAGGVEMAFGFDLGPLVARMEEFDRLAEQVAADERAYKLARERVSLCRRDIAKMIATGIDENVPTRSRTGQGPADWSEAHALFRGILARLPRNPTLPQIETVAEELTLLADEVLSLLETHTKLQNSSANESQSERHIQSSKPNLSIDPEPATEEGRTKSPSQSSLSTTSKGVFPLSMVLDACPDIADYAKGGAIANWRDFLATATVIRPMLGISPSAWEDAESALGEAPAAIVVACMLQRTEAIHSAGGYLRELTRKAEAGEFSIGPMLMALIGSRKRQKKRA